MKRLNKLYIGTNTKMYKTIKDTVSFLTKLAEETDGLDRTQFELFVIPSFTTLEKSRSCVSDDVIKIGAQNMCWEDEGQFTGEISPIMLKEVGVQIIEIGHSERRHALGEKDEDINKKVLASLNHNFTALLCIGETEAQKSYGISDEILRIQLKIGLHNVDKNQVRNLLIAYEPVWAIGVNGKPASKKYADQKHKVIRDTLIELFGEDIALDIPLLYGGSVNNENATELIKMPNVDGLFIGRSAWDAVNFNKIIRSVLPLFSDKKLKEGVM